MERAPAMGYVLRMRGLRHRPVASTSQVARTARLGALGSKLSARWAWTRLRARFARAERRQALIDTYHVRSAAEVAELLGNSKGALMKLGQMLSFVSDDVPEQYRTALAALQAAAPPMHFDLVRQVLAAELGARVREHFRDIDPQPVAAASIGQVHRARLRGGGEVAVKVQYPGVDAAIRADLANLPWLYAVIGMMSPGLDPKPLAAELAARVGEELDYEREARNQQAFATLYAGHPFIRIPAVHEALSTRRVLTTDFVDGHRLEWMLDQPDAARQRSAEVLYRFVFGSIYRFHIFNGDPHPGNYVFHDDGTVTFLDFGCTKYFSRTLMADWFRLLRAHLEGDLPRFRAMLEQLRFIAPGAAVDDRRLYDYFAYFYDGFYRDRVYTFTREYAARSIGMVFDRADPKYGDLLPLFNMPPDFAFVNRIQWGLISILAQLGATANFHRIAREHLYGDPPSTPLGAAAAAFRRDWKAARGIPADADVWCEPGGLEWAPGGAAA